MAETVLAIEVVMVLRNKGNVQMCVVVTVVTLVVMIMMVVMVMEFMFPLKVKGIYL